jgi:hypothetical protein
MVSVIVLGVVYSECFYSYVECHHAECQYAEGHIFYRVMCVIRQSAVMLVVVTMCFEKLVYIVLSVVMLSVAVLGVVYS